MQAFASYGTKRDQMKTPVTFLCFLAASTVRHAGTVFLSGNFVQDDDVVTIQITQFTAGPATFTTFGYAGGTTSNTIVVPRADSIRSWRCSTARAN